ncbi:hypothetical protein H6503_02535 [Candidatus Woesearchaeota archaeon]|nr:hypothetical protein [Candidatus Woesearchaeota archaeon]
MKSVIVTLANKDYLIAAKQLFSSIYHNSGWSGDYMILTRDVDDSDVEWFIKKGIIVKRIKPLIAERISTFHPIVIDKLYLFKKFFKRWDHVIFLDSDMIVNASLDSLLSLSGFSAVPDANNNLGFQFYHNILDEPELLATLKKRYNFKELSFNVGLLSFKTDIIKDDTFSNLMKLFNEYRDVVDYPEQAILNLYFYKKWNRLPLAYNTFVLKCIWENKVPFFFRFNPIDAIIHHLIQEKVWITKKGELYDVWMRNYKKSDRIDLQRRQTARRVFSGKEINKCNQVSSRKWIKYRLNGKLIHFLKHLNGQTFDRFLGEIGIFLKRYLPALHKIVKRK